MAAALTEFPCKGLGPVVPTDPLIYRFYEIMQVYGMPMKAVIHEKFGDGIMSAIDFTLEVDKEKDPKGDRVKVTMSASSCHIRSGSAPAAELADEVLAAGRASGGAWLSMVVCSQWGRLSALARLAPAVGINR